MHGIDTSIPHFFFHVRGTHIVVIPEIVSEVLHIPRVAHPDYLSYERQRIVSKDVLSSHFYETPSSWGDYQNPPCSGFAKGPRFLNMVMTFVLHILSRYNSISFGFHADTSPFFRPLSHLSSFFYDGAIDAATIQWNEA